ncbi:hypothetical protein [uncultured Bacteroides sp.]|uniref:hypothetical protein n=1 Tax=uncultured Bacteroides sp. TaxID=162156 RepID=UPI00259025BE|nr:hypothetical protein [uncultured Bacteroides sp.]
MIKKSFRAYITLNREEFPIRCGLKAESSGSQILERKRLGYGKRLPVHMSQPPH